MNDRDQKELVKAAEKLLRQVRNDARVPIKTEAWLRVALEPFLSDKQKEGLLDMEKAKSVILPDGRG